MKIFQHTTSKLQSRARVSEPRAAWAGLNSARPRDQTLPSRTVVRAKKSLGFQERFL